MAKNNVGFCREVEDELSARKSRSARIHKRNIEMLKKEHPEILAIYEGIADTAIDFADRIVASLQDGEALISSPRRRRSSRRPWPTPASIRSFWSQFISAGSAGIPASSTGRCAAAYVRS